METLSLLNPIDEKETVEKSVKDSLNWEEVIRQVEQIEIEAKDKNAQGQLLVRESGPVSNLQLELYWKIVRTPAFTKWFGDWKLSPDEASKVVDENGEPLVVYHSTSKDIIEGLDPKKGKAFRLLGKGVYFADESEITRNYGNQIFSCFLNIRNLVYVKKQSKNALFQTIFYSIVRPKNTGLYNKMSGLPISAVNYSEQGKDINQICALNKEQIMILPNDIDLKK